MVACWFHFMGTWCITFSIACFGAYSMKHSHVWTKDLGTDIYPGDVKSDEN